MWGKLKRPLEWFERVWGRKWFRRSLSVGFLFLVAFFLARYFVDQYDAIKEIPREVKVLPVLVSIGLFWVFMMLGAVNWYLLMRFVGEPVPFSRALRVWAFSYLGRYIPGKVGILASRLFQHAGDRTRQKRVASAFALEVVIGLLASLMVFVTTAGELVAGRGVQLQLLIALGIAFGLIALHPRVMEKGLNLLLKRMNRPAINLPLRSTHVAVLLILSLVKWAFLGLAFLTLARSFWPLGFEHYLHVVGAYSFGSIAGLLVVFAPSGLGVTEGIVVLALKNLMPGAMAVIIAVAARVWKVVSELVFVGCVWLLFRRRKGGEAIDAEREIGE